MEVKKSPKADLEGRRGLFLQIGFVLALGVILFAFEFKVSTGKVEKQTEEVEAAEEEVIEITRQDQVKPPPPPPPAPKITDVLDIVDDQEEIEDELEIEDAEADDEEDIDISVVEGDDEEADDTQVFVVVEDMPIFPGGQIGLQKHIAKSIKYPVIAQENDITGRVFVSFVVNKFGKVENVKVVRGVDPSLDKEAIRVIKSLPKWKPGKQRGKPVKVSFTVPISFTLQ